MNVNNKLYICSKPCSESKTKYGCKTCHSVPHLKMTNCNFNGECGICKPINNNIIINEDGSYNEI